MTPPVAKIVPHELTVHGETRIDNYYWLRDRSDPDVVAYLEAENAYTASVMEPAAALRRNLYDEMLARIKEDDSSVPTPHGGWFYYTRTEKGRAYAISCRKHGSLSASEEIMLDGNLLAEGRKYFRLGNFELSPDHSLLAYSVDFEGDEAYTIRVKNLASGELLADEIPNTYYSLAWTNDNQSFFYTVLDETKRPYRVYRHRLGTAAADDVLVHQEDDARFTASLAKTRSEKFIWLQLDSPLTSEVRYFEADAPASGFKIILPRKLGVEYEVEHQGHWFYIRTNEGAQNFRLMRTPVADPSRENWEQVIAARADVTIEDVDGFARYLVVSERERGLETIRIAPAGRTDEFETIEFPEPVYTVGITANPEYDTDVLRFNYSSLVTPASVFDYDLRTKTRVLKKQTQVGGYDPTLYQSERLFARAADGVEVPISVVYRKGIQRDGRNPLLLYGYGAYGLTSDPGFSSERLSLLDRGFVFAIAHIRGGGDLGKYWHEAGKLLSKRNTFTDFVACAEHLIANGYTASDRLAARGGSAGGLLMGAVLNLRPDLFRAISVRVPFVDSLTTMLDPTIPLTITEYEEWGNPEELEYYRYIRSYSPYDNVQLAHYPAMLVTTGINDPRVAYWEPAKWVAKLRSVKTDANVILLKTELGAGHFGPSGRYEQLKEAALDYAFLLQQIPHQP